MYLKRPQRTSDVNNKPFAERGKTTESSREAYLGRASLLNKIPPLFTEQRIEPRGCRPCLLISHFGGTELSKKQVVYMNPS